MRLRLWLPPVALLLALSSCARCTNPLGAGAGSSDLLRYAPNDAQMVVVVPKLGALGEKLTLLQRLKLAGVLAGLQGFDSADAFFTGLFNQVGFDPRSRQSLEAAGLAPDGGAVVVFSKRGVHTALAIRDREKVTQLVERLAGDRLGAKTRTTKPLAGGELVSFARAPAGPAEAALLVLGNVALLGARDAAARIEEIAGLPEAQSLAKDTDLTAALARLPPERDAYAYLPATAPRDNPVAAATTFSFRLSPEGLSVVADRPWPNTQASLAALAPAEGPDLLPLLPTDAFFVARFGGDPAKLVQFLPHVPPRLTAALEKAGVDLRKDVLENLKPSSVLSLSLAPSARLSAGLPSLDVRRTNPFHYVQLVGVAAVKDPAAAQKALQKAPLLGKEIGAQIEPAESEGRPVYLTRYAQGEGVHFALVKDKVLLASPQGRFVERLNVVGAGSASPGPLKDNLRTWLKQQGAGAVLDIPALTAGIQALPSEAWGIGGFAIKATALRWLSALSDLEALTVTARASGPSVQSEVMLRFVQAK